MTSIANIPPELLAEIFDAYADQYRPCESDWHPRDKYNDLLRLVRVPTDLAVVCQEWRDIAFSVPSLWRVILLKSPNNENIFKKVEKRIERSGDVTLSLYVYETNGLSEECESRPLETFIDRHAHRWYHIQLDFDLEEFSNDRPYALDFYLGHSERTFPFLHRLALGPVFPPDGNENILEATAEKFPRLTSLALSHVDVQAIQAPWAQLAILDLHQVDLPEIVFVLNHSPRLVHLRIIDIVERFSDSDVSFSTDPLVFPQLHTLDIMCRGRSTDLCLLLAHIQAPSLKRLRCHTSDAVPCPWTEGSPSNTINVLIPSPEKSCPELIIVVETTPTWDIGADEEPKFHPEFVQTHAPYSHILHLHSFGDVLEWPYARDGVPRLWGDLSHLCPFCLLSERENDDETEERDPQHPSGVSVYPPRLTHTIHTPFDCQCCVCQFLYII